MHKALYRAYRPQTFKDVVGQGHIIRTLKNQIENDNIGHAYLFSGTRGTGKTSTAKIFARAVNCIEDKDQEPCNNCEVCKDILGENIMDVVEIDAASNNSVDDIRELRESVKYSPAKAKYKVYIIDEVHMLSQGAFNALLKTLEEPPSYIIFILATTEPNKIPATILSRCQRFDFKRVTANDMETTMKKICNEEHIEAEDKALNLIARNAQGALRDALSILDQCMSFSEDNNISYNNVVDLLGTVNIDQLFGLSQYIIDQDTMNSLKSLNEFIIWGKDIRHLINDLIDHFRNLMVCKVSNDLDDIIAFPEEVIDKFKDQAKSVDNNDIIRILNILSQAQDSVKNSSNPRILVEVTMMKIAQPMFDESKESLIKRIENLEEIIESGNIKVINKQADNNINSEDIQGESESEEEVIYESVKSEDVNLIETSWKNILQKIKKDKKMPIYAILSEAKSFNVHSNMIYIVFDDNFGFAKPRLSSEDTKSYIEMVIREVLNRSFNIKIVLKSEVKNIELEINSEVHDKGEDILREIIPEGILEIKDSIEQNLDK